jgi:ribosomal protein S18 acetylase RimI-like enzyme
VSEARPSDTSRVPTVCRRSVVEADSPFLLEVYRSTREHELEHTDWTEAQKAAFVEQQFTAQDAYYREHYPRATFEVLEVAGEAVGRLYVDRWQSEIRLMEVTLLPAARGKGWGRQVLEELQAEAREVGKSLTIHVERFNPALALYDRLGFTLKEDKGVYLFLEWNPAPTVPD